MPKLNSLLDDLDEKARRDSKLEKDWMTNENIARLLKLVGYKIPEDALGPSSALPTRNDP